MPKRWTYEAAGVPHLKGDLGYNRKIAALIRSAKIPGVMGNVTGFASLFDLSKTGVKNPLIVSSTDGVGTKLELAHLQNRHDTIGIDLVAMCVNDLITTGAKPIVFLDYFATGKFDSKMTFEVLKGIVRGCRESGCALVGGETAIMPGFYQVPGKGEAPQYDLAGFSVGVVDKKKVVSGISIKKGDIILGIASSGFHSNGFSLLRKLFSKKELSGKIGRELLTPTRLYVRPVLHLLSSLKIDGIVNITGGGMVDNIPRVLPGGLGARIELGTWPRPKIFDLVRDSGNIALSEMVRTFNLGIGMVVIIKSQRVPKAQSLLKGLGLSSWPIGRIVRMQGSQPRVLIH